MFLKIQLKITFNYDYSLLPYHWNLYAFQRHPLILTYLCDKTDKIIVFPIIRHKVKHALHVVLGRLISDGLLPGATRRQCQHLHSVPDINVEGLGIYGSGYSHIDISAED